MWPLLRNKEELVSNLMPSMSGLKVLGLLAVALPGLIACGESNLRSSSLPFMVGGDMYQIPVENVDTPLNVYTSNPDLLTRERSELIKIQLPSNLVNSATVSANMDELNIRIAPYDPDYFQHEWNPSAEQAWRGTGSFDNSYVMLEKNTGLYRVYEYKGKSRWQYFTQKPDGSGDGKNQWLTSCQVGAGQDQFALNRMRCKTIFIHKGISVALSFSGLHLEKFEEIKDLTISNLDSWLQKA